MWHQKKKILFRGATSGGGSSDFGKEKCPDYVHQ